MSSVNSAAFRRLSGAKFDEVRFVALSRSNMKKGDLGKSFLGSIGLFLSLISSRLKIACHLL